MNNMNSLPFITYPRNLVSYGQMVKRANEAHTDPTLWEYYKIHWTTGLGHGILGSVVFWLANKILNKILSEDDDNLPSFPVLLLFGSTLGTALYPLISWGINKTLPHIISLALSNSSDKQPNSSSTATTPQQSGNKVVSYNGAFPTLRQHLGDNIVDMILEKSLSDKEVIKNLTSSESISKILQLARHPDLDQNLRKEWQDFLAKYPDKAKTLRKEFRDIWENNKNRGFNLGGILPGFTVESYVSRNHPGLYKVIQEIVQEQ